MPVKPTVVKFFAPVIDVTINSLMNAIDNKMKQGVNEFIILISSPGGSVMHGLSAYNYLKGLPVKITTHNFGSVDSIGVIVFCGGKVVLDLLIDLFHAGVALARRQDAQDRHALRRETAAPLAHLVH